MPDTVLGAGKTVINKTDTVMILMGLQSSGENRLLK